MKNLLGINFFLLLLFVVGAAGLVLMNRSSVVEKMKPNELISTIVLWFTAIIILQYTKETHELKQLTARQLQYQQQPILKILVHPHSPEVLRLRNIGKGAALNIELRITQIKEDGHLTNLRNLAEDDKRELFNIGEGEEQSTPTFMEIANYMKADRPDFAWGQKGIFAVVATYENINRSPFYTLAIFKLKASGNEYILKTTKTGDYSSGDIEKLVSTDWLR